MVTRILNNLTLFLFAVCGSLGAQNSATVKDTSLTEKQDLKYVSYTFDIDFKRTGTTLTGWYSNRKEIEFLTDKSLNNNYQSVSYSDYYSSDVELEGYAMVRKGNGHFKKKKVNNFYKKTTTSSGIFYEDLIRQTCYYHDLTVGSKAVISIASKISDPVLTPRCLFNYEYDCDQIVCRINVPDYVKVKMAFFGDSAGISHTAVRTATSTIHTYSCGTRPAIAFEDNSTNITYYTPHLIVVPISYNDGKQEVTLAGSPKNLFTRYNANIKEIKASDNAELNRVTDSLLVGKTDSMTKITTVFNFVQRQVKYVAFEEGRGGFVPRNCDKILANRYGDCKDKANLLIGMLNRAGIPAYYTWIGSRNKPYTYDELPSPHSDDHMIAAIRFRGEWVFLDATSPDVNFGMPSAFIQGKQAFIRLNDSDFTIQKVPVVTASLSVKNDSLRVNLKDNLLIGNGSRLVTGYVREKYKSHYDNMNGEIKPTEDITIGNNKVVIDNYKLSTNMDHYIRSSYEFKLPDYVNVFENETYVNMNLMRDFDREFIALDKRKLDIEEDFRYTIHLNIEFDIPDDKSLAELPQNRHFNGDDFSFDLQYSHKGNKLYLDKTITINHLVLKKEHFPEWNRMIDDLSKGYNDVVVLKKK